MNQVDRAADEIDVEASVAAFPTDVSGLPEATKPAFVDLASGDSSGLRIYPVAKSIGQHTLRMLSYNGSIPGPALRERFLVLARNGVEEPNLLWKDTVLVRTGETVDILMDATNPGMWMARCHIAEHGESGMMFTFEVKS